MAPLAFADSPLKATTMSVQQQHKQKNIPLQQQKMQLLKDLLEGLYHDCLFPSIGMLRMRLDEQCAKANQNEDGHSLEDFIDVARYFPDVFYVDEGNDKLKSSPILLGRVAGPSVRSITLVNPPKSFEGFVDPSIGADNYPDAVWSGFEGYLTNLARLVRSRPRSGGIGDGPHAFKGGLYEVAREIQRRRLPFFANMRLGTILHIVEVALSERKLLVREEGLIIPSAVYSTSIPTVATSGKTAANRPNEIHRPVQSLADVSRIIQEALYGHDEGLDLSMLKSKIWETSQISINENSFGCPKLLDILRLPAVAQVCRVEKHPERNSYRIFLRNGSRTRDDRESVLEAKERTRLLEAASQNPYAPPLPAAAPCHHLLATDQSSRTQALLQKPSHFAEALRGWQPSMQLSHGRCTPMPPFHGGLLAHPPGLCPQFESLEDRRNPALGHSCQSAPLSHSTMFDVEGESLEAITTPSPISVAIGQTSSALSAKLEFEAPPGLSLLDGEPAYIPLPAIISCF